MKRLVLPGLLLGLCLLGWRAPQRYYSSEKIDKVIAEAHSHLKTPYKFGGNGRPQHTGIDCSGLTQRAFAAAGIAIPRNSAQQARFYQGREVSRDELQPGDLLFFTSRGLPIGHVGLVTERNRQGIRFIHSSSNNNGVAYNYLRGKWVDKYVKARRLFRDLEESNAPSRPSRLKPTKKPTDWDELPGGEGVNDVMEYIMGKYKDAARRELSYDDIRELSPCEVRIMKNELYARHGYQFHKNPRMQAYFESQEWYNEIPKVDASSGEIFERFFSRIEKRNAIFLSAHEGSCAQIGTPKKKPVLKPESKPVPSLAPASTSVAKVPGRYPQASERYLNEQDMDGLTPCEIRIMKNEIFARHGYKFSINGSMVRYFARQQWYREIPDSNRSGGYLMSHSFSEIERANVSLLKRFEGSCD
ncbi:MAG: YARHG domain-containing protein [Bacteroidota bacterium]